MARLPSSFDLSGPASLRSGRVIASQDESAIGRGLENLGAGLSSAAAELQKQQDVVDIARAEAEKTKGLLATQNEFENDPDFNTYSQRAPEATGKVVTQAGDLIRNPKMRERWLASAQSDVARVNDGIFDKGVRLQRSAETVAFDDALETNRRIYVDPDSSDEAKAKAKQDIEGAIQSGLETGLLDPNEADARRKTFIEDAEFSRGKLAVERDPYIVGGSPVGIVVNRIIGVESGGNANAKNPRSSASGLGQFTDSTWLATIRKHRPDLAAGMRTDELLELKNSPSIGLEMTTRHTEDNKKALEAGGYKATPGNIYLAHFAGIGGARKLLAADPTETAESVLGSAVIKANPFLDGKSAGWVREWAAKKMNEGNPGWYNKLSPEQRAVINQQAETGRNQRSVEKRAEIEVAATNAPVAILNTGSYTGNIPTAEDFFQAYGPVDGANRFNTFVASMQTSEQAYGMRTMSAADIERVVREAAPTSSGDDAALQQKRYDTLSSAAANTLKAREDDPALYARRAFPNVHAAWSNPNMTGEDYQNAIAASIAAQQQLGIKNIKPIMKDTIDTLVTTYKDENLPEQDRISAVTQVLGSTADPAQKRMLFEQLVDAGLPEITEGAFEALSRGDSGAARRLFQAAMIDPSKLPGQAPHKPSEIDEAVQSQLMDEGKLGNIYYGLSDGTAENFVRAERDSKLIANSVNLRVRNGEDLDDAVEAVAKDLYGDVQVITGGWSVNAQVLAPADADPDVIVKGLVAVEPQVRDVLAERLAVPADTNKKDGTKAILDTATTNYIDNVMAEGFFRNADGGYVFIDPYVGAAVSDRQGGPIIFQLPEPEVIQEQIDKPLTDDDFDAFQKKFGK